MSTDEKNRETIANQIRTLAEKLDEIEARQLARKTALAKIDDTLTQSEIGGWFKCFLRGNFFLKYFLCCPGYSKIIDSLQVLLNFAASKTEQQ